MAKEIERKFLIDINKINTLNNGIIIKQGYIRTQNKIVVRIRIKNDKGFLTVKGENKGLTRLEYEYEIPLNDANEMLNNLCSKPIIDKTRYEIKHKEHIWEIDVFHGENNGLIVAEIEFENEEENFELPNWIVKEVTNDPKYYNSNLLDKPFRNW